MIIEYDTYTGKIIHVRIGIDNSWTEEDRASYLDDFPGRDLVQFSEELNYADKIIKNGTLVDAQFFNVYTNKDIVLSDGMDKFIASNIPEGTLIYDKEMVLLGAINEQGTLEATFDDPGLYKFYLRKPGYEWYTLGVEVK